MSLYYEVGLYVGQVVSQAMSETKNGNPQFVLTFNVLGSVDPSQPDALIKAKPGQRSVFMVFTEKTIDFLLEQLQSIGFRKPSFSFLDPGRPDHQSFVGQEIEFWCAHKEWEGSPREQWSISTGGGGLNLKPVQPAAIRKLDALYGKKLTQNVPASTTPPKTISNEEAVAAAAEGGDQIPF